jgi:hypothetical protein
MRSEESYKNAQAYLVNHVQLPAAAAEDKTEMLRYR